MKRVGNDKARLARLGAYAALFAADGFKFGEMRGGEQIKPGVIEMPWFHLGEAASKFVDLCYSDGWVLERFDWMNWSGTEEAKDLFGDPDKLATATPQQLAQVLTAQIRADRFAEGTLAEAFETGLLERIVRRAKQLSLNNPPGRRRLKGT
jgi:hypothetical protein